MAVITWCTKEDCNPGKWARAVVIAWVVVVCGSCSGPMNRGQGGGAAVSPRLRVLSYNVWVGFKNDDKRRDRAAAWIAAQKPDVVALQELNGYTIDKLQEDARAWGHPYVQLCQVKSGYHLGLTSREPIGNVHLVLVKGVSKGILHGQTCGIDFFVLHLAARPEDVRLRETAVVLPEIRKIQSADRPSVLLGDFNSPSRLDAAYYQREAKYPAQYNVMDQYYRGGWVDVVRQHQVEMSEQQASHPSRLIENKWGSWRIDYILASPQLADKCIDARVVKESATDDLSDHYPVIADFDWP